MDKQNKKTPDKTLILSIIIGALLLAGALTYANLVSTGAIQPQKAAGQERVDVPESIMSCNNGQNCIVVETRCDFCCDFVAINAIFEREYDEIFNQTCAGYKGQSCECYDLTRYPVCIRGKCQLVAWPDAGQQQQ